MRRNRLRAILATGLLITLTGCQTSAPQMMPTRPVLTPMQRADGGVCFDRDDAAALGVYILELERSLSQ